MKLVSFRQLWGADVLHIKFMRPRQDACVPTAKSCAMMLLYDNETISCKEDPAVLPKAGLSDK